MIVKNKAIFFLDWLKIFLEDIDRLRDKALFGFIQKFWPRFIVPNHLTYLRFIISVALFVLLFYFNNTNKALIISLFFVGILTDLFDGSVARCLKMETKFGSIIDPAADRVLIIPIAIYGLIARHPWLLLTILVLEIINGLVSAKNILIPPNIFAKTKMVLHSVVFGAILVFLPKSLPVFFVNILYLSVFFAVLSISLKILDISKNKNS